MSPWLISCHFCNLYNIIHNLIRNIHPTNGLRRVEFHRVVDLVDHQPLVGVLDQVHGQYTAADRRRRAQAQRLDLRRDWAKLALAAARRVGDPVFRLAVDGRQDFVADHNRPDIASRFFDELLNVKDRVLHRAQRRFMFQHCFGRIAIVDLASSRPHEPTTGLSTTG